MINASKPKESAAVFDSSALIIVAKLDALDDWRTIYGRLLVLPGVQQECIGERVTQGSEDVQRIQNALQLSTLTRVASTAAQLKQAKEWHERSHLGMGECQVLAYVHSTANTIAIVEDKRARAKARAHQIPYTTIQMSPLEGYIRNALPYTRAASLTDQVAVAMHTDLAVRNAIQLALKALATERGEINGSS